MLVYQRVNRVNDTIYFSIRTQLPRITAASSYPNVISSFDQIPNARELVTAGHAFYCGFAA